MKEPVIFDVRDVPGEPIVIMATWADCPIAGGCLLGEISEEGALALAEQLVRAARKRMGAGGVHL